MKRLMERIVAWRKSKGFFTPNNISEDGDLMLGKLMLVVTEVSEAAEAVRLNDFDNFREELADTFIRLLDICGTCDIDIEAEIRGKMLVNDERPIKHGKATTL